MARIKPGSLSGAPLWTQMDIKMPSGPRKRRSKEPIRPEQIMAWFNLAQAVAQDKAILGGLINAVTRGKREEALSKQRIMALERGQRPGAAPAATQNFESEMASRPDAVQARMQADVPPDQGRLAEDIKRQRHMISTFEAILTQEHARPGGSGEQTQITSDEHRKSIEAHLANARATLKRQLETQGGQAQVASPGGVAATPGDMPGLLAQRAGEELAQPSKKPTWEEALRSVDVADRKRESAQAAAFDAAHASTYQDLMGMAASAESGEALRAVMAKMPDVLRTDPSFAPRSLSELLFGRGGPSTQSLTSDLVKTFLRRQGREKGPYEKALTVEKARRKFTATRTDEATRPGKVQEGLGRAAKQWSSVELDKARADQATARAEKLRKEANRQKAMRSRTGKGYLGNKKEKLLTAFGSYLDEMKKAEPNIALIPKRFIKNGAIMGMGAAQGSVMAGLGQRHTARVTALMRYHSKGVKAPVGQTEQQKLRRQDSARSVVIAALAKYNEAHATAKSDPSTSKGMASAEQAERSLSAKYNAVASAVKRANSLGLSIRLIGAEGAELSTEETAPLVVESVSTD